MIVAAVEREVKVRLIIPTGSSPGFAIGVDIGLFVELAFIRSAQRASGIKTGFIIGRISLSETF